MSALVKSEGLSAVLSFIRTPPQEKGYKLATGRSMIDFLVSQAGILKEAAGIANFYLGGLISLWKKEELWKEVAEYQDWWQFGDFCKKILKMSLQKANDLARIWERSQKLGLGPEWVEKIGWGKAVVVLRGAKDKEEAQTLIREAEEMGQEQFVERVRAKTGGRSFDSTRNCRRLFLFTSDERDFIDETIEYAASTIMKKELGPQVSASEVLVFILTGWRAGS